MALFKILQGLDTKLNSSTNPVKLTEGYCYFTIDNNMFYVDHKNQSGTLVRSPLNAQNANTLTADSTTGTVAGLVQTMSSSSLEIPSCNAVYSYLHDTVIPDLEGLIDLKMDKANPTGTGSFSLNRVAGTTVGNYSVAVGYNGTAIGPYSFVAGYGAYASGSSSIALGEGVSAKSANQTVIGKYNLEDNSSTYSFIIGNGSATSTRANCFTVDWNGNAVLKGTLTVSNPTQSTHAATKSYVDTMVESVVQLTIIREV